jgi:hypothetical protein
MVPMDSLYSICTAAPTTSRFFQDKPVFTQDVANKYFALAHPGTPSQLMTPPSTNHRSGETLVLNGLWV